MASFKITDLTELASGSVADTDVLEIVDLDADQSKKVTIASLKTVFAGGGVSEGDSYTGGTANGIMFNDGDTFATSSNLTWDGSSLSAGDISFRPLDSVPSIQGVYFKGTTGSNWQIAATNSVTYVGANNNVQIWSAGVYRGSIQSAGWHIGDSQITPQAKLHTSLSSDVVGNRLDLSNGQTEDAFQINSYGNTGGDLFRVESNGDMYGNGRIEWQLTGQTGWNFYVDSLGSNTHVIGGGNTLDVYHSNMKHSGTSKFAYGSSNKTITIGSSIHDSSSAILSIISTTKGVLLPRMTTTQRDAIPSPATGLLIFNTTTKKLDYYSGTAWGQV